MIAPHRPKEEAPFLEFRRKKEGHKGEAYGLLACNRNVYSVYRAVSDRAGLRPAEAAA